MAEIDLARTNSYQYPNGHLGYLNDAQETRLAEFKTLCKEKKYYSPASSDPEKAASHSDETMLRYLRARKFIPAEAFKQFKDTEDWRKENQLEKLYTTIDINEYEQTRRLYPQWTGRRDKRGIPLYVFEVGHLNSKAVAAYEQSTSKSDQIQSKVPVKMLRLFALYENLINFVLPLCSHLARPHTNTPVDQCNNIVDISKVSIRQFWNLKSHMQDASTLATAHYPETLDRIFIIGAPSFFPTVWSWIKRWFDPVTVSKIFVLSATQVKPVLEQYVDIENIPKKYGGQLDWSFGQMPKLDPAIQDRLQWIQPSKRKDGDNTFPTGPLRWEPAESVNSTESQGGKITTAFTARAVGSENKALRHFAVATLTPSTLPSAHLTVSPSAQPQDPNASPMYKTTSGIHTHPKDEDVPQQDLDVMLPPGTGSDESSEHSTPPNGVSTSGKEKAPNTTAGNATTAPAAVEKTSDNPLVTGGFREGTSEMRLEQQDGTHAEGNLADGTPEINHHGGGDKTTTVEPNTVGQAPKEHPLPIEDTRGEKGYVEQAKDAVLAGVEKVEEMVGLTKKDDAAAEEPPVDPQDEKQKAQVDKLEGEHVEEFLRGHYHSQAQQKS